MRACDNKVDELKAQHAAVITAKDTAFAKLEHAAATNEASLRDVTAQNAALTAENAALKAAVAGLEAQVAVLEAHATSKLADIHAAIVALQAPQSPPPPGAIADVCGIRPRLVHRRLRNDLEGRHRRGHQHARARDAKKRWRLPDTSQHRTVAAAPLSSRGCRPAEAGPVLNMPVHCRRV
jgi:hypothetical protein